MPVRTLDEWATARALPYPLNALKDASIGIEASHYLSCFCYRQPVTPYPATEEPLLTAHGGSPLELQSRIEDDLQKLKAADIRPIFVFNGMDIAAKEIFPEGYEISMRENARAWEMYGESDRDLANEAIEVFRKSGSVKPVDLYRFLQKILHSHNIEFIVAPYHACAQLAYMEKSPMQCVDAVWGSSELFLYGANKIISKIDHGYSQFSVLDRGVIQDHLGRIPTDVFVDACLLCGTSFLPTFPILETPTPPRKPFNIREAVNMLMAFGRSVTNLYSNYQDDPRVQELDYLDRFRRAYMAIKHHVVLTEKGDVLPLDKAQAPSDLHEFIGQRLPEELYFYLCQGLIGPRVLNWLTSGHLVELPPLDNGETDAYRRLVRTQLDTYRLQSLSLLAQPLHRFYHRKDVTAHFWFDRDLEQVLSFKDLVPSPREVISKWNAKDAVIKPRRTALSAKGRRDVLSFAVLSLEDEKFASQTITQAQSSSPLKTADEILSNTLWRLLHLRGVANDKHTLTGWGKALSATFNALDPSDHLEEAAFLAIEMLRLDLLNANSIFSKHVGDPVRGSEQDQKNCLLLSRLACLGTLSHKSAGYAGPLSRNLLGFSGFISAVRNALRDETEMVTANLFLNGDADREQKDWTQLGFDLPFLGDYDYGLGIAVKMYLDEVVQRLSDDPQALSAETRREIKVQGNTDWFPQVSDLPADLDRAFRLFDAVSKGVKVAGKEVKNAEHWAQTEKWLAERR